MTDASRDDDREKLRRVQASIAQALRSDRGILAETATGPEPVRLLHAEELRQAAEVLIRKRLSQTRACLPIATFLLGSDYESLFRAFASDHFFPGQDAIWQDAIEFARHTLASKDLERWHRDAFRWELSRCQWEYRSYLVTAVKTQTTFRESLHLAPGSVPTRSPRLWCFWRFGHRGAIHSVRLP